MELNEAQQQAVRHVKGPCMVLAGPGSGKTAVITHRTRYLIEEAGIHPSKILVITFTRAAALEMKERFQRLMQGADAPCTFGTFHSVFYRMLRAAYGYSGDQILTEEQKYQIMRELVNRHELEYEDEEEFVREIIGEITLVKSEYMPLEHYYSTTCGEEEFRMLYQEYEAALRKENKLDFDDMLIFTYELLKERPDILAMWQKHYPYILIDEFQDINKIQYEIVKLLARAERNLFIVGDDDQSIYRFRGARPEIMLGFQKDYPDAEVILLNVNYRSNREIVEGSLRLIQNNTKRYEKNLTANREYEHPIYIHEYKTSAEENQDIISKIRQYHAQGITYREMAVIFRTNTEPRTLVNKLMEYDIPFRMRDKLPNCYEHFLARHLIAYIRIAMGSREREDFLTIWNRPKRYLKRDLLANDRSGTVNLDHVLQQVEDKNWAVKNIHKLQGDIKTLETLKPYSAINYIRKGIGYDEYIVEYAKERHMKEEELLDKLDELQEMARPFESYEAWFRHIETYGEQLEEQRQKQQELHKEADAVTLTTMHSAKGLEYEVVFLMEANEGITPYKKAVKPEELEEERRMFYVAVTRAKSTLHIYYIKERYNKNLLPSRFVNEIRFDTRMLSVGTAIRHRAYGMGVITYVSKEKVSICFEETKQTKTFNVQYLLEHGLLSA